jgi:nitrate reductase molybdenum cofactor assembly chaperone
MVAGGHMHQDGKEVDARYEQYSILAELFSYPDNSFGERVRGVQAYLEASCPEAAEELSGFTEFASQATLKELEEVFTRSFDVQALTTIDLGYVLFGDDYKRGELLVKLNAEHRDAGVDCGSELSDYLPNVLRLLHRMEKPELRDELVLKIVAPALRRILREFDPERLETKSKVYEKHHKTLIEQSQRYGTIYAKTIRALYTVLGGDFVVDAPATKTAPRQSTFLNSIGTEMTLECKKGNCHGSS